MKHSLALICVALLVLSFVAGPIASTNASGVVRPGFNTFQLAANDDLYTDLVAIGFPVNFYGTTYNSLYVNNNGNVTFDAQLGTYTPFPLLTTSRIIIAAFFADVDTRVGAVVTYGNGTVDGHNTFGVTWPGVRCYDAGGTEAAGLNYFQLLLVDRSDTGAGNFDIEFNYDAISWETGQASGGDTLCQGGNAVRVGYSNGSTQSYELPGSGVPGAFLDSNTITGLIHNSQNSELAGRYVWYVRNGVVLPSNYPPTVTNAYPSKSLLFPNLQMMAINVLGVTDPEGDPFTIAITGIRQDERCDTSRNGTYTPDGAGVGTSTAWVRAERINTAFERGNGRVYHIYFTATDVNSNDANGEVIVTVPLTTLMPAVDNAPNFDSAASAP